jgi:hypothetical protein
MYHEVGGRRPVLIKYSNNCGTTYRRIQEIENTESQTDSLSANKDNAKMLQAGLKHTATPEQPTILTDQRVLEGPSQMFKFRRLRLLEVHLDVKDTTIERISDESPLDFSGAKGTTNAALNGERSQNLLTEDPKMALDEPRSDLTNNFLAQNLSTGEISRHEQKQEGSGHSVWTGNPIKATFAPTSPRPILLAG